MRCAYEHSKLCLLIFVPFHCLLYRALYNYNDPSPIIFSTDESAEISIADVARSIAKAAKYPKELEFDTTKSDGQFKKTADNTKLKTLCPEFQFTSFEEGIQKTVDWFWQNYEVARK